MLEIVIKKLDGLLEELGINEMVALLESTLPYIAERRVALRHCLQANDWDAAQQVARKTVGSVRLYGSPELELLLQQVRQQERAVIATAEFQETLDTEFSCIIQTLEAWLAAHPLSTQ